MTHLLDDIAALLPGGGEALPGVDVGALLLVDELGDGDLDQAADFLGRGVADLPRHRLVVTHLHTRSQVTRLQGWQDYEYI